MTMTRLYSSLLGQHSPSTAPGLVETVQTYEGYVTLIFVDGQLVESLYKQEFEPTLLKRSFIQKACSISGVDEDSLRFVFIDWHAYGLRCAKQAGAFYDANEYEDYASLLNAFQAWGRSSAQPFEARSLGVGIRDLEAMF